MSALLLAAITHFAVPATGEGKVLPDSLPRDAVKDAPCVIIAARGEYEGGSFVLFADENLGKADMSVGPLKNEKGDIFPAGNLDLATVKVWYQNSNAWISYFQDPELTLCPELLLHDEDLVKVDVAKKGNWARITGKGGEVDYFWLTAPRGVHKRDVDFRAGRNDDAFHCMQVGFSDSPKFAGATLERGKYKQFMLTAHVGKEVKAGLYCGTVKVVSRRSGEILCEVPVRLRVLDFELPSPKTYYDPDKDFISYFCEYVSMEWILASNGNDAKLAERQLEAILKNFVRHNEITPSFGESIKYKDLAERCGMDFKGAFMGQMRLGRMPRRGMPRATRRAIWRGFSAHIKECSFRGAMNTACISCAPSAIWLRYTTMKAFRSRLILSRDFREAPTSPICGGRRRVQITIRRGRSRSTTRPLPTGEWVGMQCSMSELRTRRSFAVSTVWGRILPVFHATTIMRTIFRGGMTLKRGFTSR